MVRLAIAVIGAVSLLAGETCNHVPTRSFVSAGRLIVTAKKPGASDDDASNDASDAHSEPSESDSEEETLRNEEDSELSESEEETLRNEGDSELSESEEETLRNEGDSELSDNNDQDTPPDNPDDAESSENHNDSEVSQILSATTRTLEKTDQSQQTDEHRVFFVFGRFNPPHIGHKKIFDALKREAGKYKENSEYAKIEA
jgi:hypothetical protein